VFDDNDNNDDDDDDDDDDVDDDNNNNNNLLFNTGTVSSKDCRFSDIEILRKLYNLQ